MVKQQIYNAVSYTHLDVYKRQIYEGGVQLIHMVYLRRKL